MDLERYAAYSEYIEFSRPRDGVLQVTLNRPERLNSLVDSMLSEVAQMWWDFQEDDHTRVIVLTGAGRAFCAGLDQAQRSASEPLNVMHIMRNSRKRLYGQLRLDKPVVAAINGPAVGIGLSLALLSDITIAANDAILMDGHTRVGVTAGDHAALIWPLLVGMSKAKYYALLSERMSGEEAERIGLVTMSVPKDEVLGRALEIAERLARGSQTAIRWTKCALNAWLVEALPKHELSSALEMLGLHGDDNREARQAFAEKREPVFPSALAATPS